MSGHCSQNNINMDALFVLLLSESSFLSAVFVVTIIIFFPRPCRYVCLFFVGSSVLRCALYYGEGSHTRITIIMLVFYYYYVS